MAALFNFPPTFPNLSSDSENLTATAGGTQAAGLPLVARYNRVTTVATAGDSVVLPPWAVDTTLWVGNDGAANMNVFPYAGQQINALGQNNAFSVTAGKTALFIGSGVSGKWAALLSA